jgi:hypothetical protein
MSETWRYPRGEDRDREPWPDDDAYESYYSRDQRFPASPQSPPRRPRTGMTGRDGVVLVIASAALGGFGTLLTGGKPGALLGGCIVVGTLVAALTVQPRVSYVIAPVPALVYPVAAVIAGYLGGAAAGSSRTALALGALQWIARGFVWMVAATAVAMVTAAVRRASLTRRPRRH